MQSYKLPSSLRLRHDVKDDWRLLRYGLLTALLISVVLEPIDIHNCHFPTDAATGLAHGISTYVCGVGRVT